MRAIIAIAFVLGLSGCSATLEKRLSQAAALAVGPCGQSIAQAAAVCKTEMPR